MATAKLAPKDDTLFRIPPFFYIHVLDQNTNVTRLEIGPKIYIRQDNERSVDCIRRRYTFVGHRYCDCWYDTELSLCFNNNITD